MGALIASAKSWLTAGTKASFGCDAKARRRVKARSAARRALLAAGGDHAGKESVQLSYRATRALPNRSKAQASTAHCSESYTDSIRESESHASVPRVECCPSPSPPLTSVHWHRKACADQLFALLRIPPSSSPPIAPEREGRGRPSAAAASVRRAPSEAARAKTHIASPRTRALQLRPAAFRRERRWQGVRTALVRAGRSCGDGACGSACVERRPPRHFSGTAG